MPADPQRALLRHTLATLAYRGQKAVEGALKKMVHFRAGKTTRSGVEILSHIADLMTWAYSHAAGTPRRVQKPPQSWAQESKRFYAGMKRLDQYLASGKPLKCSVEKLFQGPIADSLTHVGQLATLRRLCGSPVRGENYLKAQIVTGRLGKKQSAKRVEFD